MIRHLNLYSVCGFMLICLFSLVPSAEAKRSMLIVNAGSNPSGNLCKFKKDIQLVARAFRADQKVVLYADGFDPQPDTEVCDDLGNTLKDAQGLPLLENTTLADMPFLTGPSSVSEFMNWMHDLAAGAQEGDDLVLYWIGHSWIDVQQQKDGGISGKHTFALWKDSLSVEDFRELLLRLPLAEKFIGIFDLCSSGLLLDAYFDSNGMPLRPGICGFSGTGYDRFSEGGYVPELIDEEETNKSVDKQKGFLGAHQSLSGSVFRTHPLSTSEVFLEKYFDRVVLKDQSFSMNTIRFVHDELVKLTYGGLRTYFITEAQRSEEFRFEFALMTGLITLRVWPTEDSLKFSEDAAVSSIPLYSEKLDQKHHAIKAQFERAILDTQMLPQQIEQDLAQTEHSLIAFDQGVANLKRAVAFYYIISKDRSAELSAYLDLLSCEQSPMDLKKGYELQEYFRR